MPFQNIRPGMQGEALTVFSGTKVEKFNVEVLKVLHHDFDSEKLILVKLSGKAIKRVGGLAAGMSGSPVYIRGSLVGAISYGFENADPYLAYITPIDSMLKLLDNGNKMAYFTYYRSSKRLAPIVTPIMISGIGPSGYARLSQAFDNMGLRSVFLPAQTNQDSPGQHRDQFGPGSAVAVQLVTGDCRASAIGTVTFVDGKHFLAFGHSFTNKGKVDFLAYEAQIHHILKSPQLPMKIGGPLYPVGRIVADRNSGIAGILDEYPEMIDVTVNIKDAERNQVATRKFQVIGQEQFYRNLITEVAAAAIDRTIDRVGSGTAKVTFALQADERPAFARENLFYSPDIAIGSMKELGAVIEAFADNEFVATKLKTVQIDVQIENYNSTAKIQKMEVDRVKAKPGEAINAKVYLHSYRGVNFVKSFLVKIPESFAPGKIILAVRGGAEKPGENPDPAKKAFVRPSEPLIGSFEQLVASLTDTPKNNELVLEVFETGSKDGNGLSGQPVRLKLPTEYYLSGQLQQELEIEKENVLK